MLNKENRTPVNNPYEEFEDVFILRDSVSLSDFHFTIFVRDAERYICVEEVRVERLVGFSMCVFGMIDGDFLG